MVAEHKKADEGLFSARLFVERQERAIRLLAMFLEDRDLYVVFPKKLTGRQEEHVERKNDGFCGLYRRLRDDNLKRGVAIKTAAEMQGYELTRAYEIVNLREGQPRLAQA